jgi:hypothetical protein
VEVRESAKAFEASLDEVCGVVVLELSGALDESTLEEGAVSATALALQHDCTRFLIDTRRICRMVSGLALLRFGRGLEDLGYRSGHRLVVVYSQFPREHGFFEKVAVQSGYAVRVFSDEERALAWLGCSESVS